MSNSGPRRLLASRAGMVAVAGLQWLLSTAALGALVIHTDQSLEGLIGYHIDVGVALIGGAILGFLLGATVQRTRALIPLVIMTCVGASALYFAVLFIPVWTGVLVHTSGLENFATTRALLYFGIAIIPVSVGALAGKLLSGLLPGGNLLSDREARQAEGWWLNRPLNPDADAKRQRDAR